MTDRPIDRLIDGCEWISANEVERSQIPSFYLTEGSLDYVLGEAAPVDKGNIHSVIILCLLLFSNSSQQTLWPTNFKRTGKDKVSYSQ